MQRPHVALITGASRGLGATLARRLAHAGVGLVLASRNGQDCATLAQELAPVAPFACGLSIDVTEPASIRAGVDRARELAQDFGPIDWLVNNAGIALTGSALKDGELYERQLDVNFHGARRMIEALAPKMLEADYGRIVNIASSAGLRGYAYVAAYCASKHALIGYTRSLALELARTGVHVNAVCPHYVDSPMLEASIARIVDKTGRAPDKVRAFFKQENPGGQLVQPAEVAEAALELLQGTAQGALLELIGGKARTLEALPAKSPNTNA